MKPIVGVIMIIVGVVCLVYGGIKYTKTEKVIDIGPLQVEAEKDKKISVPPLAGVVLVGAGIAILLLKK